LLTTDGFRLETIGNSVMPAALQQIALVGLGGFVGSVLRYGVSGFAQRWDPAASFPYGTMAVNALGCFAIGVLAGLSESRQIFGPELRLFVFIGVLGGFTTFSTFGYETHALLREGDHLKAGANVLLSVALCLVFVWFGHALGRVR
jgi:CrcB protein